MTALATQGPWYVVGPAMGLLIVAMLWLVNKPFGASGGYSDVIQWLRSPTGSPQWRLFFLLGMIGGGGLFALMSGHWQLTWDYGSFDQLWGLTLPGKGAFLVGAGMLIGFGARMAGGCTSGHGLCGTSYGSPDSFVGTATFMAVAMVVVNALTWGLGGVR